MLILTRRDGERIRFRYPGGDIWVTVTAIEHGRVQLGIAAPAEVKIHREEVLPKEDEKKT